MSAPQRAAWLRLSRCDGVGPATFRDLINHFGTAERALDALPDLASRSGRRRIRIPDAGAIANEIERLQAMGGRLVCSGEPDYPAPLLSYDAAPMVLSVLGSGDALARTAIGIVGSRQGSLASIKLTRAFALAFGEAGYTVASGLARGIDAAAHEGSLRTGTVACMAGGLDRIWPPQNENLAEAIVAEGGALVTEMPLGWQGRAKDFPRRNRVIAGMSVGLLVVEAALRSGSLITARLANEMGREVFAIPGSPLDPRSAGTNGLIRDGATFTIEPADVIEALRPSHGAPAPKPAAIVAEAPETIYAPAPDETDRARVVSALDRTPVGVDEIVRFTGLSAQAVQLILLELDLAGTLVRHTGNRVSTT